MGCKCKSKTVQTTKQQTVQPVKTTVKEDLEKYYKNNGGN